MKQPSSIHLARLWLLLATLFLAACGRDDPAQRAAEAEAGLAAANELLYAGEVDLAIARLEALEQQAPGNTAIVEALAFAYAKQPDPGMAAIYFDQAHELDPDNADLALYAARAYDESDNPKAAAEAYRAYLADNPGDAVAWKALARTEAGQNRQKPALDAFLEAFRQSRQPPDAGEAAFVGHLYHGVGNTTQATRWYEAALAANPARNDRLTAQLGLFDLALRAQDWPRALELMAAIDADFPGELDNGPYASARAELEKWQAAQAELAANATINLPGDEPPSGEPGTAPGEASAPATLGNLAEATDPATAKGGGSTTVDLTAEVQAGSASAPAGGLTVDDVETVDGESVSPLPLAEPGDAPAPPALTAAGRGDLAYEAEDYVSAIRFYRQAMADSPQDADLAYRLSRAYYNHGDYREAELFGSEATRLNPNEVKYRLNYLRAIQRTQGKDLLMRELVRAKERFPDSPDVTLALGRAYEVIQGNTRNARFLYEEFLTLAPEHPRADDIRAKLETLPQ